MKRTTEAEMRPILRLCGAAVLAALIASAAGCGGSGDSEKTSEDFRVPDSLLSPIEGFKLVRDDYHPVDGGVMASADIELHYPPSEIARFIAVKSFGEMQKGYTHVLQDIGRPVDGKVVIIGAKDLDEYMVMTRKEWWYYAWIKGDTIYSEPLNILLKRWDPITERTLSEIGFTNRFAQLALDGMSAGRIPVWLKESTASYVADERAVLRQQIHQFNDELEGFAPALDELEDHILAGSDIKMSRLSYFYAYLMFENLLERVKFADIMEFVRRLGDGESLDEASIYAFGMGYEELISTVRPKDILEGAGPLPEPGEKEGHHHDHDH
jgi:hypothetical protein